MVDPTAGRLAVPVPGASTRTPKRSAANTSTATKRGKKKPADPVLEELRARQAQLHKHRQEAVRDGHLLPKVTKAEQRFRDDYAAWMRGQVGTPDQARVAQIQATAFDEAVHRTVYGGDINMMNKDDW